MGSWTGQTSGSSATLTVLSDGTFTGSNDGCAFNGTVAPRSTGKHVLDGKVTFNTTACTLGAGASMTFDVFVNGNQQTFAPQPTSGVPPVLMLFLRRNATRFFCFSKEKTPSRRAIA